jgi:acyl carrier protein
MESVESKVRQFIIDNFLFGEGADGLKSGDSLLDKGLIDSTGILELVSFLQNCFHVEVEDNEIVPENLDSILRIAAYVRRKSANGIEANNNGGGSRQEGRKQS